jgi:hypothetical protein
MLDRVTRLVLVLVCSALGCAKSEDRITTLESRIAELERKVGEQDESLQNLGKTGVVKDTESSGAFVKSGVKACDDYLEKYTKCITDKVPASGRKEMFEALATSAKAWKEAAEGPAREGVEMACKAAYDVAKRATESMGCEF